MHLDRVVVVGASLAAVSLSRSLREFGFDGELVLVTEEEFQPYDRPPLSKGFLAGEESEEAILLETNNLKAQIVTGTRAVGLDVDKRIVRTNAGEYRYDGLAIATGVRPRLVAGLTADGDKVHVLRTLQDAKNLKNKLVSSPKVLIIGAGFIAIEVASVARNYGCEVTIVSKQEPLADFGIEVSETASRMMTESDVTVISSGPLGDINIDLGTATTSEGQKLEFELVVVAVGSTPNTEWLEQSGLIIQDGVVCDSEGRTLGADSIVAVGDVARWKTDVAGTESKRFEHWTNAINQGRMAAKTLLGLEQGVTPLPTFWSDHFGSRLQGVGLTRNADRYECVAGDPSSGKFVVQAFKDEVSVGALGYGMPKEMAMQTVALSKH